MINITLPVWLTICLGVLILFEKVIHLIHSKPAQNIVHRVYIMLFFHNDEEFYKAQMAKKKAKQARCRNNHQNGNNYRDTSLQDLANKNKQDNTYHKE